MTTQWHERWQEGRIGFHEAEVNRDLLTHADAFLGTQTHRVLVPLCGKSVDLLWLAERGHEVVGVELVPQAVDAFFADSGLAPEESQAGNVRVVRGQTAKGSITLLCGDIFEVDAALVGAVDRIWDRAALVALPPDVRGRYTAHLRSLAQPGAVLLQNAFEYDTAVMDGPPFSVPDAEVRKHYEGAEIRVLSEGDVIAETPKFQERGHSYWLLRNYLITL